MISRSDQYITLIACEDCWRRSGHLSGNVTAIDVLCRVRLRVAASSYKVSEVCIASLAVGFIADGLGTRSLCHTQDFAALLFLTDDVMG